MNNHPFVLYKYYSINDHSIDALINNRVWLSNPAAFNDPFDCGLTLDIISHNIERHDYFEAIYHRNGKAKDLSVISEAPVPEWVLSIGIHNLKDKLNSIGVCSFCEENKSILMWSHYADRHRGFCIEYDCSPENELSKNIKRIEYVNEIPLITVKKYNRSNEDEKKAYLARLASIKSLEWKYEKEWRLVKDYNNDYFKEQLAIKSVYFGAKMPETECFKIINLIRNKVQNSKMVFYKMKKSEVSFELQVNQLLHY